MVGAFCELRCVHAFLANIIGSVGFTSLVTSLADPVSCAFLTPGYGINFFSGSWIPPVVLRAYYKLFGLKILKFLSLTQIFFCVCSEL